MMHRAGVRVKSSSRRIYYMDGFLRRVIGTGPFDIVTPEQGMVMGIRVEDALSVNVVFVGTGLLTGPGELDRFRDAAGVEVVGDIPGALVDPDGNVPPVQVNTFRIAKDRVAIQSSSPRTNIVREYPEFEDLQRLAQLATYAIEHTDSERRQITAFGFNIDLVFEQDSGESAGTYLAKRLFSDSFLEDSQSLISGAASLAFLENGNRWGLVIEPRFKKEDTTKLFVSLNLHLNKTEIPTLEECHQYLMEIWKRARSGVMARINDRV